MFKYENVPDGAADYSDGREYFVGIAAVLENSSEYREVKLFFSLINFIFPPLFEHSLFHTPGGKSASILPFCG